MRYKVTWKAKHHKKECGCVVQSKKDAEGVCERLKKNAAKFDVEWEKEPTIQETKEPLNPEGWGH